MGADGGDEEVDGDGRGGGMAWGVVFLVVFESAEPGVGRGDVGYGSGFCRRCRSVISEVIWMGAVEGIRDEEGGGSTVRLERYHRGRHGSGQQVRGMV